VPGFQTFADGLDSSLDCVVLAERASDRALPGTLPDSCATVEQRCPGFFDDD
jgi:hypothetical protein